MKNLKNFFANGLLLTSAALIMRSVSVSFGAYVSRTAGTEAMGLFGLVMSVFGFALTVATSGINLAVTRMVSEALAENDHGLARMSLRKSLFYCLFCSLFASCMLIALSKPIGLEILKDKRAIFPLRILAIALPFISVSSALAGYFTAVRRVWKNTVWQVMEQLIKMYFTVKLFEIYIGRGVEYACIALVVADLISEISAFLLSYLFYILDRKKYIGSDATTVSERTAEKQLYSIAVPVAFSTYIRSGLITVEHILIPRGLIRSGLAKEAALSSYGVLHSMVMPVLLFPTAVLASFSGLLIPELSDAQVKKEKARVRNIATHAFRAALLFSFGISGFFLCFSDELGILIYKSSEAGEYMHILAPLIPVMYLDSVTDAMLKGLGEQVYSMNVNILDAILSIILVLILLPAYGMKGYIITIYITELINATLSVSRLLQVTKVKTHAMRWLFCPLISVLPAVGLTRLLYDITPFAFTQKNSIIIFGVLAFALYLVFARITQAYGRDDLRSLRSVFRH